MPPHLAQIGGAATAAALLALPGAVAALAAEFGHGGAGGADRRVGRVQPRTGRRGRRPAPGPAVPAVRQRGDRRRGDDQRAGRHLRRPARPACTPPRRRCSGCSPSWSGPPPCHRSASAQPIAPLVGAARRRATPAAGRRYAATLAGQPRPPGRWPPPRCPPRWPLVSLAPLLCRRAGRAAPDARPRSGRGHRRSCYPAAGTRSTRHTCSPRCCSPRPPRWPPPASAAGVGPGRCRWCCPASRSPC